jgi:endonuclease YncB( thermonuclease family)
MPFVALAFALVLCVAALSANVLAGDSTDVAFSGTATVIDGDGLEVAGKKVRLFGVDAPETSQYCKAEGGYRRRCGQYATVELDRMAGGKPVVCTPKDTDRYGRVVAVCKVEGRDVGREMVRAGWAVAYVRYSKDYVADERWARENEKGIWGEEFDGVEMPWDFRSRNHGNR